MNILTVKKTIPFKGLVVDDVTKNIKAVFYNCTYTLRTQQTADITYEEAHIRQNISYSTVNAFLWDQIHQSVIYDLESKQAVENIFSPYTNNFIFLPSITESVLLNCLHAKLNTICHETSIIEVVTLKEMDEEIEYEMFSDDFDYSGLPTMKDWLGDYPVWDTPWWYRKDFSTYDNYFPNKEEYDEYFENTDINNVAEQMSKPIKDIEQHVKADMIKDSEEPVEKEKGQLIEVDFFKKKHLKEIPKEPK